MKNRIITISREFGSGGRTIGKMTAKELGIPCYDAELIHEIARQSGFDERYIQDAGEYSLGGLLSETLRSRAAGRAAADLCFGDEKTAFRHRSDREFPQWSRKTRRLIAEAPPELRKIQKIVIFAAMIAVNITFELHPPATL